ncbi:MAG TPA: histone deacetylase family protein [Rhizomicrobium sp.]|jgi:acetoin utilization deacetylase AcuC-like enzyme|nr:histone deacetylase family protein [Rhizomicrobium sp.]
MTTALVTHAACFGHEPPPEHPERPARLSAMLDTVRRLQVIEKEAPRAPIEALRRAHTGQLVDSVLGLWNEQASRSGYLALDADTFISARSAEAALCAAGAVIAAADGVAVGEFQNAFCAVRPPGHHAERDRAMGFCLFNNVAIGARHARAAHGFVRIAVVDFDVHHGNGTQDIFFDDPNLFYASSHQMPLYPGTGFASERGVSNNVLNCPLQPGSGSAEFRAVYRDSVLPAVEQFAPDFIFMSAGFDAHRADPLANLNLHEDDFAWITHEICTVAKRVCGGRVVSTLEGGYDLDALAASAAAHVQALIEA